MNQQILTNGSTLGRGFSCNGWYLSDGRVERCVVNLETFQKRDQPALSILSPGWSPVSIWLVQNLLRILILKTEENKLALWYFDADDQFIGNSADGIWFQGPWVRESFEALFRRLLLECVAPLQHEPNLIPEAIEPISAEFLVLADDLFASAKDLTNDLASPEGRILNASPADVQDEILKCAMGEMKVEWRGRWLRATRGIVVNDFLIAYPLFEGNSLSALMFIGSHTGVRVSCLDLVNMDLCYRRVAGFVGSPKYLTDLVEHLRLRWHLLRNYFEELEPSPIIGITRSGHIGHRLWNELSGLHRIKQNGDEAHLRALIHFDRHDVGEIWLSASQLLQRPDLEVLFAGGGKISIAQWIYENKMFPLRIGDSYIDKKLVNLVQTHCLDRDGALIPAKERGELRIVFGLRFENRTWINQTEGLVELACHLAHRVPKLTIILDGHDCIDGKKVMSSSEHLANEDIVDLEKQVVRAVEAELARQGQLGHVKIVDAVDMELRNTMEWVVSADFFVAPWGAGLAKYKWVANLDGVIFSSREVVETRPDLKIYEDQKIREGATECVYLPAQYVVEQPKSSTLISIAGEGGMRENFIVDIAGLKVTVDQLVAQVHRSGE